MSSPLEFTVAMWVQFEYPGETGTYFTLYSVDSEYYPTNRKVLMQAMNAGMIIIYFFIFQKFRENHMYFHPLQEFTLISLTDWQKPYF